MLKKLRLFRIRSCYREIAKLENKVPFQEAAELRVAFAAETLHMVDVAKRHGMSRPQRRRLKRLLVNGHAKGAV